MVEQPHQPEKSVEKGGLQRAHVNRSAVVVVARRRQPCLDNQSGSARVTTLNVMQRYGFFGLAFTTRPTAGSASETARY